ncbi:hypothetical protein DesfrDRAFT_3552 [Solidesulfovibrio fructosivorans JJ]]|uniref:Uncharacterized protein n=1 Tax=Solidesulfovibrio fructosivorans JJ] TaxID=596151 RepID=E1K102_SOLFR|nr:hypothetical protein DesfrDRAFT_3552 [Solidesulfovibrio fructosivorans JJ]]
MIEHRDCHAGKWRAGSGEHATRHKGKAFAVVGREFRVPGDEVLVLRSETAFRLGRDIGSQFDGGLGCGFTHRVGGGQRVGCWLCRRDCRTAVGVDLADTVIDGDGISILGRPGQRGGISNGHYRGIYGERRGWREGLLFNTKFDANGCPLFTMPVNPDIIFFLKCYRDLVNPFIAFEIIVAQQRFVVKPEEAALELFAVVDLGDNTRRLLRFVHGKGIVRNDNGRPADLVGFAKYDRIGQNWGGKRGNEQE